MLDHVNFRPWVGKDYHSGGILNQKVLILGESHYCSWLKEGGNCYPICTKDKMYDECFSLTGDVVNNYIHNYSGKPSEHTYLCFEKALFGRDICQEERELLWNSIIFYNFFQYAQSGPRKPLEQKEDSSLAFKEMLETYSPDRIIIWGKRLYNSMPNWHGRSETVEINGYSLPVWVYPIKGKESPGMCVPHPSCPVGKKWQFWHPFYSKFLGIDLY